MSSGSEKRLKVGNSEIYECADCGLFSEVLLPPPGEAARCGRCRNILRHSKAYSLDATLAFAITGLCFYIVAMAAPFIKARLYGSINIATLTTGPQYLDQESFWLLASVVALTTVVMPLLKLSGLIIVLVGLRRPHPPTWLASLFSLLRHVNVWSMVEVYLIGFLVAYARLKVLMSVEMGFAVYALVGLMVAMSGIDAKLDPQEVWEEMDKKAGEKTPAEEQGTLMGCDICHLVSHAHESDGCSRCGTPLHRRKPYSVQKTLALTAAAAIFYLPSNYFPVMTISKFGRAQSYTIFGGLKEFIHAGLWPLAVLVFTASIFIPMFKLASLGYLLTKTTSKSKINARMHTRVFRIIEFIGRWSMVDIFMVSILVALVHFGVYAHISAGPGAIYFASVVILTILAVNAFDPRLIWDAERERNGRR